MTSDFEKSATQAAVDAVEARWKKGNEQRLRQIARKRWRNTGAVLFLLAVATFVVVSFVGNDDFTMADFGSKAVELLHRRGLTRQQSDNVQNVDGFGQQLKSIVDAPVRLFKDLPSTDNPKRACAGTIFPVLSTDGRNGFRVFAISPDGNGGLLAMRCSPFRENCRISWSAFRRECVKPYLIRIDAYSYLCGSSDLHDADKLQASVRQFTGSTD